MWGGSSALGNPRDALYIAQPLTGERYITEVEFYTITVLLFSYTVIVIGSQLR